MMQFNQYNIEPVAFLLGRLLFGGYLAYKGVNHFLNLEGMAGFTASKGVPLPEVAVIVTGLLLVVGGLSIAAGLYPRIGVAMIALFFIGVTPVMHNFWAISDPSQSAAQLESFVRNFALMGGALALLMITEWPYSVQERFLG